MHQIAPYESAVTLFGRNGEVFAFKSKQHALRVLKLAWIRENVGHDFLTFSHTEFNGEGHGFPVYIGADYVMRDDWGTPLVASDFEALIQKRTAARYSGYRGRYGLLRGWNGEGPVPGIRKWRGGGHYYRRIQYAAALRQACPVFEDGEVAPRGRRNLRNLPNAWDDYRCSARDVKNWKRFRKHQWKDKAAAEGAAPPETSVRVWDAS